MSGTRERHQVRSAIILLHTTPFHYISNFAYLCRNSPIFVASIREGSANAARSQEVCCGKVISQRYAHMQNNQCSSQTVSFASSRPSRQPSQQQQQQQQRSSLLLGLLVEGAILKASSTSPLASLSLTVAAAKAGKRSIPSSSRRDHTADHRAALDSLQQPVAYPRTADCNAALSSMRQGQEDPKHQLDYQRQHACDNFAPVHQQMGWVASSPSACQQKRQHLHPPCDDGMARARQSMNRGPSTYIPMQQGLQRSQIAIRGSSNSSVHLKGNKPAGHGGRPGDQSSINEAVVVLGGHAAGQYKRQRTQPYSLPLYNHWDDGRGTFVSTC